MSHDALLSSLLTQSGGDLLSRLPQVMGYAGVFVPKPPDRYDAAFLKAIAPSYKSRPGWSRAQDGIIQAVGAVLTDTLRRYDMATDLRAAHFAAQCCHETAGFRTTTEFASGEAYEGREDLGNMKKGDGPRYKGRGLIQLTGRANYRDYGKALGLDLEEKPAIAAEPATSLLIACEFWTRNRLNTYADKDDVLSISKVINLGSTTRRRRDGTLMMPNGLEDRRKYVILAKRALGLEPAPTAIRSTRSLRLHDRGAAVKDLQRRLNAAGYRVASDGHFGRATEAALRLFQKAKGLVADGVAGPRTLAALGMN